MPSKWQQWMPFKIDSFRGSAAVQAMHPTARSGYLYLLTSAWQSEDCTISSDPLDLAEESGLGDDLWKEFGARILRKFIAIENGRLRNSVLFEAWKDAKRIFDANHCTPEELHRKRSQAGRKGNEVRWNNNANDRNGNKNRSHNDRKASPTVTGTVTGIKISTGERASAPHPGEPLMPIDDNPEANIPDGLSIVQYRQFACEQLQTAKSYRNQVAFQEGIEAIVEHEGMTLPQATLAIIQRGRAHPPDKGNWNFWVNDGGWKKLSGISTEGME